MYLLLHLVQSFIYTANLSSVSTLTQSWGIREIFWKRRHSNYQYPEEGATQTKRNERVVAGRRNRESEVLMMTRKHQGTGEGLHG